MRCLGTEYCCSADDTMLYVLGLKGAGSVSSGRMMEGCEWVSRLRFNLEKIEVICTDQYLDLRRRKDVAFRKSRKTLKYILCAKTKGLFVTSVRSMWLFLKKDCFHGEILSCFKIWIEWNTFLLFTTVSTVVPEVNWWFLFSVHQIWHFSDSLPVPGP